MTTLNALPLAELARQSAAYNEPAAGDWVDEQGHLRCGVCGERKTVDKMIPAVEALKIAAHSLRVGVPCRCRREWMERQQAQEAAQAHRRLVERIRKAGMADAAYREMTFEKDDQRNASVGGAARMYVEAWEEMRAQNIGMLLQGGVGTGKTFYACCIANALAEKELGVMVSTVPELISRMTRYDGGREETVARIQSAALLVLDDLGSERSTEFSAEQLFSIVDARSRSGKPLIVTTNLSPQQMDDRTELKYNRIYDRVLEMCPIRIAMTGESRRRQRFDERRSLARSIIADARKMQQPDDTV